MRKTLNKVTADSAAANHVDIPLDLAETLRTIQHDLADVLEQLSGTVKDYLTVGEFAARVGRSDYTVRQWRREGRITAQRITGTGPKGRLLIHRSELEKVVQHGLGEQVNAILTERSHAD